VAYIYNKGKERSRNENKEIGDMRTNLLSHNETAYKKVMRAFESADRTCVVHPTGTGKSYLIAAVSESFKRVLILGPNTFVLDQVHSVLKWRKRGVEYMTYQTLNLTENPHTDYDLICLDEFHRTGAPEWGAAVDRLLELNTCAKVFGTTATHIRYLDNERNMADELFGGNIASHITIAEAWNQNILPIPRYVSGLFRWDKTVGDAQERIERSRSLSDKEKRERIFRLSNAKLRWELSYGMPAILKKHLDKDARRVIVFCGNIESLGQMHDEVVGWFREAGFTVASTCIMHSDLTDREQREQMDRFEDDTDGKGVKLMFSVNMLNEGIHVPNVNAVLMLRTTSSRIIYMQQMGRCLTAANTEKPLVLDMVDNITTTTAIKGLQDEFDAIEIPQAEHEGREPRKFEVKDYTLGVRDLIEKLVPERKTYTYEERLSAVTAFCESRGRLPYRSDGREINLHYASLRQYYGNRPEVVELLSKYDGKMIDFDTRIGRLQSFVEERGRLPIKKLEPLEHQNYAAVYHYHKFKCYDERVQAILDKFARKVYSDEELLNRFVDFVEEHGYLPRYHASKQESGLRIAVKKRLGDHPKVKELTEKYKDTNMNGGLRATFDERLSRLKAFISEHGRLPYTTETSDYNNFIRLRVLNKQKNNPEVSEIIDKYGQSQKNDDQAVRMILNFYKEHGRLPVKNNGADKEERSLAVILSRRKQIKEHPEIAALIADKLSPAEKRRKNCDDRVKRQILSFIEKYNRLPRYTEKGSDEYRLAGQWNKRRDRICADDPQMKYLIIKLKQ
jgi:superfamily II DNA or RNA helicase